MGRSDRQSSLDLAAIARRTEPGEAAGSFTLIDAARYHDPDHFAREQSRVFDRTWQVGGRLSEFGETRGHFVKRIGDRSLLFTRDDAGVVRGFVNACRHRGCEVAAVARSGGKIVCPYHGWTYRLDGSLVRLPAEAGFGELDPAHFALRPVQVDSWAGFIWFNPDTLAPSLSDYLGPAADHADRFHWDTLSIIHEASALIDANWKVVLDNFNENYHVPLVHRATSAPFMDCGETVYEQLGDHRRFFNPYAYGRLSEDDGTPPATASQRLRRDCDEASRMLVYNYQIFPNTLMFPVAEYTVSAQVIPRGVDRSELRYAYLAMPPENDTEREDLAERLAFYQAIFSEDFNLLPTIQHGLASGAIDYVPLGGRETNVISFHATLDRYMSRPA